jgi:predicted nucleotidyltransferase component of viral defense system
MESLGERRREWAVVITSREIADAANEWQLRHDVVEKDYVLGWLLAGIAAHASTERWAFKGGTCLRKCWFETYRFSEDLDFTVTDDRDLDPVHLSTEFTEIGRWMHERAGLELQVDEQSFRQRKNRRGQPTIQARIAYVGPLRTPTAPKVKLDLTADEVIVTALERRPVFHPFTDVESSGLGHSDHLTDVWSYSIVELLGEKLRALAERCRPRDLYDVVHMHRHPDLLGRSSEVNDVLARKCVHAGIDVPTRTSMSATPFREEVETEWSNMLGHQLPHLPPFAAFWAELDEVFEWLDGKVLVPLQSIPVREEVEDWRPARYMTNWRTGAPIEMIRFAGANRLKIVIDYRAEQGRRGPRVVEPYAFRRSRAGALLLFVRNDRGLVRSYRVDRIAGVSVEPETFEPRFRVEF